MQIRQWGQNGQSSYSFSGSYSAMQSNIKVNSSNLVSSSNSWSNMYGNPSSIAGLLANSIPAKSVNGQFAFLTANRIVANQSIQSPIITGGSISIGSGNNVFKADSNGIYLGNAAFASAPFRVNMAGAVVASDITITNGDIGTGSDWTGNVIAAAYIDNLNANKITAGTLDAARIGAGTITASKIASNTITAAEIASSTITATEIASNAITAAKINAGAVTAAKISVSDLSAINADLGTVTAGFAALSRVSIGGSSAQPFYCWGLYIDSSANINEVNEIRGTNTGVIDMGTSGRIQITGNVDPTGGGTYNLGGATRYWNDISYKTLTDRGCLGWFDNGVVMPDGKGGTIQVSDVESILMIKKHPTQRTIYGTEKLDYSSFPVVSYKRATDHNGKELPRDKDDRPYFKEKVKKVTGYQSLVIDGKIVKDKNGRTVRQAVVEETEEVTYAEDGIEMTSFQSIMLGAIKQLATENAQLAEQIRELQAINNVPQGKPLSWEHLVSNQ